MSNDGPQKYQLGSNRSSRVGATLYDEEVIMRRHRLGDANPCADIANTQAVYGSDGVLTCRPIGQQAGEVTTKWEPKLIETPDGWIPIVPNSNWLILGAVVVGLLILRR